MEPSYKLIGIFDDVEVFQRGDRRTVELSATGEIAGPPHIVQSTLLSHTNPRVMASLAEGWAAGVCPAMDRFALRARWSTGELPGVSFKIVDDRGAITRPTNWVTEVTGSWSFEPVEDGSWTHAIYHVRIDYANAVSPWAIQANALNDVPTLFQTLRALVGDRRSAQRIAASSGR
jgi:hypothetical protein